MEGEKIIGYNAFSAAGIDTTALISDVEAAGSESKADDNDHQTTITKAKADSDDGGTCSLCMQVGMMVVNTLLSFVFAIIIIILTAVGKRNVSTYDGMHDLDKRCDCTLFTPSLSYGLAVALFIEIGLMVTLIIFAVISTVIDDTINKYPKFLSYFATVAGSLIVLNFFAFLCMTIAVIVFVAMGTSACCSATSIAVASLSTFLLVVKTLFICCFCCIIFTSK